jgi:hypothetical protein
MARQIGKRKYNDGYRRVTGLQFVVYLAKWVEYVHGRPIRQYNDNTHGIRGWNG